MTLPNPNMVFDALDQLPASDMNDLVENIDSLAFGTGFSNSAIDILKFKNPYKFCVTLGTNQSLPATTWTKLNMNTEDWDTNGNFNTTDAKYVAPVSGYYHITGTAQMLSQYGTPFLIGISKNTINTEYRRLGEIPNCGGNTTLSGSTDVYLTAGDYICLCAYSGTASKIIQSGFYTQFSGYLVSLT